VRDVRVREQPQSDFTGVDVLNELSQLRVRLDDIFERQRVIYLGVVFQGIDLVVPDETLNGETIFAIVPATYQCCSP
jgi:hypothetical protein